MILTFVAAASERSMHALVMNNEVTESAAIGAVRLTSRREMRLEER